jgi:tripartite ATP-independent transporter DctP family solute receptor
MHKSDEKSAHGCGTDQGELDRSRRSFLTGTSRMLAGSAAMALGGMTIGPASTRAIAQNTSKAKIVAKYGHDSGPGSGLQYFGEYFAGRVAQLTDGEVEVQIFPNSQLGSTTEMTQAVRQGNLEFALPTGVLAGSVITPELGVFGLPYLIKSWQQAGRVEYSQAGELLRQRASQKGVRILAFAPNALRNLYYNMRGDKPVLRVEDVEGMKIRVIESPIDVGAWKACGALPTPIAFNEVFNAVQQKVVDGVDNAFNSAASIHLEEVINAVTLTNHRYEVNLFITNESWFKNQSKRVQEAMQTAAREASIYQQGIVMWDDIRIPKLWTAQKKIRTVVPDLSGFTKKMTNIYPQFEEKFGKEIMQLVEKV